MNKRSAGIATVLLALVTVAVSCGSGNSSPQKLSNAEEGSERDIVAERFGMALASSDFDAFLAVLSNAERADIEQSGAEAREFWNSESDGLEVRGFSIELISAESMAAIYRFHAERCRVKNLPSVTTAMSNDDQEVAIPLDSDVPGEFVCVEHGGDIQLVQVDGVWYGSLEFISN